MKKSRPIVSPRQADETASATGQCFGHFDQLAEIERFRASQQAMVRAQYETAQLTDQPASRPYLRRASHRR